MQDFICSKSGATLNEFSTEPKVSCYWTSVPVPLCPTNVMSEHKGAHQCMWHRDTLGWKSEVTLGWREGLSGELDLLALEESGPTWTHLDLPGRGWEQQLGQTGLWSTLDSGRALHSFMDSLGTSGFHLSFCTWCCPLGFTTPGPSARTGAVCSSWDENQLQGHGSQLRKAGLPSPGWWRSCLRRSSSKLRHSWRTEHEIDRWMNAASIVMWLGYRSTVVKKELSPKGFWIWGPTPPTPSLEEESGLTDVWASLLGPGQVGEGGWDERPAVAKLDTNVIKVSGYCSSEFSFVLKQHSKT